MELAARLLERLGVPPHVVRWLCELGLLAAAVATVRPFASESRRVCMGALNAPFRWRVGSS